MDDLRYIIYGTTWCGFCTKARDLLSAENLIFDFLDLTEDEEYIEEVKAFYNSKTIPVILEVASDGRVSYVGGCSDLQDRISS